MKKKKKKKRLKQRKKKNKVRRKKEKGKRLPSFQSNFDPSLVFYSLANQITHYYGIIVQKFEIICELLTIDLSHL